MGIERAASSAVSQHDTVLGASAGASGDEDEGLCHDCGAVSGEPCAPDCDTRCFDCRELLRHCTCSGRA